MDEELTRGLVRKLAGWIVIGISAAAVLRKRGSSDLADAIMERVEIDQELLTILAGIPSYAVEIEGVMNRAKSSVARNP